MSIAISILGFTGKMGKKILELAQNDPLFSVVGVHSREQPNLSAAISQCDVAIDFSIADAVPKNADACARAGVALVVGTTGWQNQLDEVKNVVSQYDGALIYGANFSVGAQVFFRIAAAASELFRNLESYDGFIEESHHKRKRDAPSGTALQLGEIVATHLGREVPISSTRAGHIPGTHRIGFDSSADQITLEHVARSREGFALGALMAAKWIVGRKGVYEFSEVFDEMLGHRDPETQSK